MFNRRTGYRSTGLAKLSALTVGNVSGRHRRRRRRQRTVIAAVALLVAAAVVWVLALSPGTGAGRGPAGAGAPGGAGAPATSTVAHGRRQDPQFTAVRMRGLETRAINKVLRYTPFIAGGTRQRRAIALTFDDGPGPYTSQIVRILVQMHVPATFFIVGQQLTAFSAGLRDELHHGFVVGDHTENHAWLIRLSPAAQYAQIHAAAVGLQRLGAPSPRLFRPPYGVFNAATMAILHRLKLLMVLWSIDPGDWRRPGARAIVSGALAAARPGAIVILHDGGGDRSETVAALPAIINGLRRRHYQLVSVPQLLLADPPPAHQRLPHLSGV